MSHKVHQKIYRINKIEDWHSRGFYGKKIKDYLKQDYEIRSFLEKKLPKEFVEKIIIERKGSKINIFVFTSRPGLIIGRKGEGIEKIKKELEKILKLKSEKDFSLQIKEVENPWTSAELVAKWMALQIEKRIPYRRVLKQALSRILANNQVEGAKVQVSGRLNGVEVARTEWLQQGKLKRITLRSNIDYALAEAICKYGKIGIKVWIYKGEKVE